MFATAGHLKRSVRAAAPAWLCLATVGSVGSSCTLLADDFEPKLHSSVSDPDGEAAVANDAAGPGLIEMPDCGAPSGDCGTTPDLDSDIPLARDAATDAAGTAPMSGGISPGIDDETSRDGGTGIDTCNNDRQDRGEMGIDCGADGCPPCPCVLGNFSRPEPLTGLAFDGSVFGPALSADDRTLFFSAVVADFERIYSATRRAAGSTAFSAVSEVVGINTGSGEGTPFLNRDGSRLYFYSSRAGSRDLWFAERAGDGGGFSEPVPVPGVNTASIEHLPWLTPDELTLFFSSDRTGGFDIWVASRPSRGDSFGAPVNRLALNTNDVEGKLALSSDGLTAFFSSSRVGGLGQGDIWIASRSDLTRSFSPPTNLTEVNSPATDVDGTPSADGLELFFSSSRAGGSFELWRAQRQCL